MEALSKIPDSTKRKEECKRITGYGYKKVNEWCNERFKMSFAKTYKAIRDKKLMSN